MIHKITDNLWRGWGVLALLYMIFWWVALLIWYVPFTSGFWVGGYAEAVSGFLFVTAGLFGMVFSGFVVWTCFKR